MRSLSPLPRTRMYPISNFKSSSRASATSETRTPPAVEKLNHGVIAERQRLATGSVVFRPRRQHASDLIAAERFGQHLPLLRQIDIQRRIFFDFLVEQQMPIQLPDSRKLSSDRTPIEPMGKQFLEIFANILAPRPNKIDPAFSEERAKLREVAGISRNGQSRRSALNPEIVEERRQRSRICVGGHAVSMDCPVEFRKVPRSIHGVIVVFILQELFSVTPCNKSTA